MTILEKLTGKSIQEIKEESRKKIIEYYKEIQPFKCVNDIPEVPILDEESYKSIIIPNLIRCGAIPKDKLIIGHKYLGSCRNSEEATWNGKCFVYERCKFGYVFDDKINHFEDDNGYDVFVPIKDITN